MATFNRGPLRRDRLEDGDDRDRWLISYADFITLLFGFFVVMYAISSVNEGKYKVLTATLMETFNQTQRSIDPIQVGEPARHSSPNVIDFREMSTSVDTTEGDTNIDDQEDEDLEEVFKGLDQMSNATVAETADWLEITVPADVLFEAGSARLTGAATLALEDVASRLKSLDNPITVEGYSDNVTVSGGPFDSNWVLSAARASRVIEYFVSRGLGPERFSAVGYGENHPIATNGTPEGRARNRRVTLVVAREGKPGPSRNLWGSVAVMRKDIVPEDEPVEPQRTESGGLLFTNEPE